MEHPIDAEYIPQFNPDELLAFESLPYILFMEFRNRFMIASYPVIRELYHD